jgi:hypothetical protein
MSGALDKMSDDDLKQLQQMEADDRAYDAENPPAIEPEPEGAPSEPTEPAPTEPEAAATSEPQQNKVDQGALHAERERRKKVEAAAEAERVKHAADMAKVQERLNLLMQVAEASQPAQASPPPAPEVAPDPNQDPMGYVHYVERKHAREMEEIRQRVVPVEQLRANLEQAATAHTQQQDLRNWAITQEMEAESDAPDYRQAMAHLKNSRVTELHAIGITEPAHLEQVLRTEVAQLATHARQSGKHFGRMLYDIARLRGYQPAAAAAPAPPAPSPAPSPTPPAAPPDRVAMARRGADMASGLGSGGSAPRGELTPSALAEMSEAEFEAVYNKMKGNSAALRQAFGA